MAKKQQTPELGLKGKGVEAIVIEEVDDAIVAYVAARDARMELTKKEVETKDALMAVLRKHADQIGRDANDAINYKHDEKIWTLQHGEDELKSTKIAKETNGE